MWVCCVIKYISVHALVEQSVPLVEHERAQGLQPTSERLVLDVIPQPTRRRDEQINLRGRGSIV